MRIQVYVYYMYVCVELTDLQQKLSERSDVCINIKQFIKYRASVLVANRYIYTVVLYIAVTAIQCNCVAHTTQYFQHQPTPTRQNAKSCHISPHHATS